MMPRFFNCNDLNWFGNHRFHANRRRMYCIPPVNISETDKEFVIEMAAPGYDKKDFNVSVDKNLLSVAAEKNAEAQACGAENSEARCCGSEPCNEGRKIFRKEFCVRSFSRTFSLPEGVDVQNIGGSYENGILTLTIPKATVVNTKKSVEIQ